MTISKNEIKENNHSCFHSMVQYLTNMLDSKDYIIKMFKDEILRKSQLIEDLLDR